MTTDRLERRLPEVLNELALPRVPDYVDNLLSRTERMSQRPGWTFLERWFPVSTFTATLSRGGRLSPRPLIAVAILVAIVIASIVLYIGSQRRLPPLFGPARNGAVVTNDQAGNIVLVDPVAGTSRILAHGPNLCCAGFTPDGLHVTYLHVPPEGGDPTAGSVANLDGSIVRELPTELLKGLDWAEWTPAGDRILLTTAAGAAIFDLATGSITQIDTDFAVTRASWIGATGDILLTSVAETSPNGQTLRVDRLAAGATSGATQIATLEYAVNPPLVSPDGSKFLYFIWGPEAGRHGRIHIVDLASGIHTTITRDDAQAPAGLAEWENPVWSPDGSHIAAELYTTAGNRIAVVPAAMLTGDPIFVGPTFEEFTNGAAIRFSPDGTELLVTYHGDGTTWLLPTAGGEGHQVPWATSEDMEWQRLAP